MKTSFLESGGVNCGDSSMHAIFAIDEGCQGYNDAVIATCCIVVEMEEGASGKYGKIILEFF